MTKSEKNEYYIGHISEAPFARDGMSEDEYFEEKRYFVEHFEEWIAGTYQPLWKQRINNG